MGMAYFGVGFLKRSPDNHEVGFNPRGANSPGFGAFSGASDGSGRQINLYPPNG